MEDATTNIPAEAQELIDFWLGSGDEWRGGLWELGLLNSLSKAGMSPAQLQELTGRHIRERFADKLLPRDPAMWLTQNQNARGPLSDWETTPVGKVALVILFSQVTRCAYRGTSRMLVYDDLAQRVAADALADEEGFAQLPWGHRLFLHLALMESEDPAVVRDAANSFLKSVQPLARDKSAFNTLKGVHKQFGSRLACLRTFGRYPFRNELLGRESTDEETQWLARSAKAGRKNMPWWARPLANNVKTGGGGGASQEKKQQQEPSQNPAAAAAMNTTTTRPLRLLVLHGNHQTVMSLKRKAKKALAGLGCHLHWAQGPHEAPPRNNNKGGQGKNDGNSGRCWWVTTPGNNNTMEYRGLAESIRYLEAECEHFGPFDGVLGFSQGGCMAAILAARQSDGLAKHARFRFLVSISAPYCRDTREEYRGSHLSAFPQHGEEHAEGTVKARDPPIALPSFHTWGLKDTMVLPWRSKLLSDAFADAVTVPHPEGHFSKAVAQWPIEQMRTWLDPFRIKKNQKGGVMNGGNDAADGAHDDEEWLALHSRLSKRSLDDRITGTLRRATFIEDRPFVLRPVGLARPQVTQDPFWKQLCDAVPVMSPEGVTQEQCAQFVARWLRNGGKEGKKEEEEEAAQAAHDLMLLAFCCFPHPQHLSRRRRKEWAVSSRQAGGEVFCWLWYEIIRQLPAALRARMTPEYVSLVTRCGSWKGLLWLDLLARTGEPHGKPGHANHADAKADLDRLASSTEDALADSPALLVHSCIAQCFAEALTESVVTCAELEEEGRRDGEDARSRYVSLVSARQSLAVRKSHVLGALGQVAPTLRNYHEKATGLSSLIALRLAMLVKAEAAADNAPAGLADTAAMRPRSLYKHARQQVARAASRYTADGLSRAKADVSKSGHYLALSDAEWQTLWQAPTSTAVLDPEAEPVTVSTAEQMAPLHEFLQAVPEGIGSDNLVFSRGTVCPDGRLDLCKQVIGPQGIDQLMTSLEADAKRERHLVTHILLGNNVAGDGLPRSIARFLLSGRSKLTTWYIAGNQITAAGLAPLADALAQDKQVQQLWLKRNPLRAAGAKVLAGMLRVNTYLRVLDLTCTGLTDEGAQHLAAGLRENRTLQFLYADGCGIGVPGAKAMAGYLADTPDSGLLGFSLGCNRLGCEGAEHIARAVTKHKTLTRLGLSSAGIREKGAAALAQMLTHNKTLRHLDLGFPMSTAALGECPNRIGTAGAVALADSLRQNDTLLGLNITHNNVSQQGLDALCSAMCDAPTKCVLVRAIVQQFGVPTNELTMEAIRGRARANYDRLSAEDKKMADEAVAPSHLQEILSVYRVGHKYKDGDNVKKVE